jgi:hypothetical protein
VNIQAYQVILESVILVLVTGFGFWAKHVFTQQVAMKDVAIQALQSALTSKDAEIARLTSETAPQLAQRYMQMTQYVDHMTGIATESESRLHEAESRLRRTLERVGTFNEKQKRNLDSLKRINSATGELDGLIRASGFWMAAVRPYIGPDKSAPTAEEWLQIAMSVHSSITEAARTRFELIEAERQALESQLE